MKKFTKWFLITVISLACQGTAVRNTIHQKMEVSDTTETLKPFIPDYSQLISKVDSVHQDISKVTGHEVVDFAKILLGIPYTYASSNPFKGFDCSGFITYVFNHFYIQVPRSSVDFTNTGKEIELRNAKEGDLILFTGTAPSIRIVGHMGIVTENIDTLKFIHSTSGKANGVTVSVLNNNYKRRFVKVIRVLSD